MALTPPNVGDNLVVARNDHGASGYVDLGDRVQVTDVSMFGQREIIEVNKQDSEGNNTGTIFRMFFRACDVFDAENPPPRSLTIDDLPIGTNVVLNTTTWTTYGLPIGSEGTVERHEGREIRVRFDDVENPQSMWLYPSTVVLSDMSLITDAGAWKRRAIRILFDHKAKNGWCETAEALAVKIGLGDYLPVQTNVTLPSTVRVRRFPGDSDADVQAVAARMIREGGARQGTAEINDLEQPYTPDNGYHVDATPEGETFEQYKQRVGQTAMLGARTHNVAGVPDFLRAIGIDPDSIIEQRTLYATIEITVPVGAGTDVRQYARDMFTLALPSDVTISDAWGA